MKDIKMNTQRTLKTQAPQSPQSPVYLIQSYTTVKSISRFEDSTEIESLFNNICDVKTWTKLLDNCTFNIIKPANGKIFEIYYDNFKTTVNLLTDRYCTELTINTLKASK